MSREAWNPSMSLNTITLPEYTQSEIEKDRKEMLKKMADRSIIDVTGTYHIIPHFMRAVILGRRNFIRQDLSLVTHSSLSQLKHLSLLVEGWDGLVSVAVFVSGSDVNLLIETILLLRRCSPQIRFKTSFHLVFPLQSVDTPNQHIPRLELVSRVSCPLIHEFFLGMGQEGRNYAQSNLAYPNNILRNVGRRHALTEYVLVIDVDLIVSHGLRSSFLQFAQQNNLFEDDDHHDDKRSDANNNRYEKEDGGSGYKKNVYVLPAYEMSRDMDVSKIPWNKTSLLKIMNDSKGSEVRPFYVELCWKCQKHTEYDVWEKEPETSKLTVLFEVLWKDPWEPFYISRNDVPFYDERFKQYGFNRISQVSFSSNDCLE